jgi:cytochrome c biogenesis protein CcdA/thiol-disulfide isomerase/thioredoxin
MEVVLATLFAVVAGAATALSPCVLPVLPLALAAGSTGGRRRPLGVALGLAWAFTLAAVALTSLLDAAGLPGDAARTPAIVVLAAFGIALMVPPLGAAVEGRLSRLVRRAPAAGRADGLRSGLVLGVSLGLVYAPCAGPILAAVLAVDATVSPARALLGLAYGTGAAAALLGLMLAGRTVARRLARRAGRLQQGIGAVMVATAVLLALGLDRDFQATIADDLPAVLVNPTGGLESTAPVERALAGVRSRPVRLAGGTGLRRLGPAPEFTGTQRWFNTPGGRPLTLRGLRGRVVLVDFWTYTCINCLRTLPYLRAWDARYRRAGLTIVGVHTPEFPFERDAGNVKAAIAAGRLRYPVAQDNRMATWNAYLNNYWPAKYLVDAGGQLRFVHFGEGAYGATERAIRTLLAEARGRSPGAGARPVRAERAAAGELTPETYLGWQLAQGRAAWEGRLLPMGDHDFGTGTPALPRDQFAFRGRWRIDGRGATAGRGARIEANVRARRVFLVLGSPRRPGTVRVRVDGRPLSDALAGDDVRGGAARVRAQRLYRLVDLGRVRTARLSLEVARGVSGYAFTFG